MKTVKSIVSMKVVYQVHLFATGFRLDLSLWSVYKSFRKKWRLQAKAKILHKITEWLRLEGTFDSHFIQLPAQVESTTAIL